MRRRRSTLRPTNGTGGTSRAATGRRHSDRLRPDRRADLLRQRISRTRGRLADEGARIIFVPFCTDSRLRVRYCGQARAIENQCFVVLSGNVGNLPNVAIWTSSMRKAAVRLSLRARRDAAEASENVETLTISDINLADLSWARAEGTVRNPRGSPLRPLSDRMGRGRQASKPRPRRAIVDDAIQRKRGLAMREGRSANARRGRGLRVFHVFHRVGLAGTEPRICRMAELSLSPMSVARITPVIGFIRSACLSVRSVCWCSSTRWLNHVTISDPEALAICGVRSCCCSGSGSS